MQSTHPFIPLSISASLLPSSPSITYSPTAYLSRPEETGWSMPVSASLCARLQGPERESERRRQCQLQLSGSCAHSDASPAYVVIYDWCLGTSSCACSWSLAAASLVLQLTLALALAAVVLAWPPCQGLSGNEGDERS